MSKFSEKPLLKDVLPELAEELQMLLRSEGETDLSAQVSTLCIMDRCRCGDEFCATIYTATPPKGAWGAGHETIPLAPEKGYINVDVVHGKIVEIEVLYRAEIRERLLRLVP